jgi:hypothetical protein
MTRSRLLLADRAVDKFADYVEVADMAGVLLEQVQQNSLKRGRRSAVPPLAGLPDLVQRVSFDDSAAADCLGLEGCHEIG